jgi:sigma-B regulation protein RsbU (phosphoserine phosphatase)
VIRELIDTALLEDFADGLARAGNLRVAVYDARNHLIAAAAPGEGTRTPAPAELPPHPLRQPSDADEPPPSLAFFEHERTTFALAPVHLGDEPAGFVAIGETDVIISPAAVRTRAPAEGDEPPAPVLLAVRPQIDAAKAVVSVRWAARLLSAWCRRESQVLAASEQLSLVGDIAELLTGEQDLQSILNHIVADTARVMKCRFCSLRLYDAQTEELRVAAAHNLSQRYLNKGAVLRRQNSVDDAAMSGQIVYVEDVATDPRTRYPAEARREGIVSALTAGLIYRGKPVGVLHVYTDRRQRFRTSQRNLLRAVASQAAMAIVHAQLMAERLRKAELDRQLQLAGQIQARMVRSGAPQSAVLETARVFEPSSHVGGDFCDFLTLADGRTAAVVADVSGKGMPASLLMASVRGALRALAMHSGSVGEIMTRLNAHVCHETAPSEFVTMQLVAIDPDGRRLGYANAGHEPLLILRDGRVRYFEDGGLVLGIEPGERYEEATVELRPNDVLLLYTDGVVEAMNFERELFGRERLRQSLVANGRLATDAALRAILWDIRRFVGLAEQSDDLTLVGIRVRSE